MNIKIIYLSLVSLTACLMVTTHSYAQIFNNENSSSKSASVEKVTSTSALILEGGEKIRLIGLKAAPPPKRKEIQTDENHIIIEEVNPLTTVEEQALKFAKQLLEKKQVTLEFDAQRKDDDFVTVAYVFLPDKTFVNAEILRQGFANLSIVPPNTKYASELRAAYQEARKEKRGLQGE